MLSYVIAIIAGFFIWLVLPKLILKKASKSAKLFINITCKIIGAYIIFSSIINLIKTILE
jgi:hypothetical protein